MDKEKLAEKLYQAFIRKHREAKGGVVSQKIGALKNRKAAYRHAWLHVAEIAIANVCDQEKCEHVEAARRQAIEACANAAADRPHDAGHADESAQSVLADINEGIACAIGAANFDALLKLIGFKAQLLGVRDPPSLRRPARRERPS